MMTSRVLFTVLSALVALGCDQRRAESTPTAANPITAAESSAIPTPTVSAAASATSAQTPTVAAKMAEHFTSSAALRDSLIKGDLGAFRAAAATLSDKELSANVSDTWKPHLEGMRMAAKRARDAKTIDTGAQALADVGRACAGCHEKLGGPKLTVGAPPAPGSGAKPHMARHHWAAARMWEGLMAPSQEAWTKGTEVFTDAPLQEEAIAGAKSVPPEVGELAKRAHAFGQQAHSAKDAPARAKAVADVYGTCVGCHAKLSVTIK
ncbi:hypothetical protein BH11MYX4_BH11MYX4_00980 [soil metagenome]